MALTLDPATILVLALVALICRFGYLNLFSLTRVPKEIPWIGTEKYIFFSRARAMLASIFHTRELCEDGYNKFSKKGKAFVLPNLLTGPEIIVPTSQLRWLLTQPESVLSQFTATRQFLESDYTLLGPTSAAQISVREHILRKDFAREYNVLAEPIVEELNFALQSSWGINTENWKTVKVYSDSTDILSQMVSRMFVGLPLCRNPDYLDGCRKFGRLVAINAAAINLVPSFLKVVLAPLITTYDRMQYERCAKHLVPLIKVRMEEYEKHSENPDIVYEEPNDCLQWLIRQAFETWEPKDCNPDRICKTLVVFTFVATQTSSVTLSNCLFDIAGLPNSTEVFEALRVEAKQVLEENGGIWDRAALAKLVKIDSTLRESMRFWGGISSRGPVKAVVGARGVTTPDGVHLPFGTKIGVSAHAVHHDEAFYENSMVYEPFRFSDPSKVYLTTMPPFETKVEAKIGGSEVEKGEEKKGHVPLSLNTTSPEFLPFGHGKYSCPGRFFAANQMKMLLANMILFYEVQPITTTPERKWFASNIAPPLYDGLQIRRRRA